MLDGAGLVDLGVKHLGGRLGYWIFMLATWEGAWDSGSSCWTLGKEAGIVDLHVGHLGGRLGHWMSQHEDIHYASLPPKCPT